MDLCELHFSVLLFMSKLRNSKTTLPVSPSQLVTGVPEPPHDHLLLVLLGGDGQGVPHRHPPVLASCQQSDQSLPLASQAGLECAKEESQMIHGG